MKNIYIVKLSDFDNLFIYIFTMIIPVVNHELSVYDQVP